jgi:TolB-like protein/DNA-binding winged helix-turn-helix (wHTH) protein/tetratricopeptide (TPR) repeat protein
MSVRSKVTSIYRFGAFEVDQQLCELRRSGVKLRIQEQPYQVLLKLLEHPGEIVSRDELRSALWPADTFVDFETGLNTAIKRLRETLSDSADNPTFIETIPRRGYKFMVPVRTQPALTPAKRQILRWSIVVVTVIGLLAAVSLVLDLSGVRERLVADFSRRGITSIAVLPFVNASNDPNSEYLSDGITETLIASLSQISNLRVMSAATIFAYKHRDVDPREAGRKLRVTAILQGKVTKHGDAMSIRADLVNVKDGAEIWGEEYTRTTADVLTVQSEIAHEIMRKLRIRVSGEEEKRLSRRTTKNLEAYQLYLKGLHYSKTFTKEGLEKSAQFFEQAIALDPNYASAYNGLAFNYGVAEDWLFPPREVMPKSKAAAEKAALLDETFGDAHANIAYAQFFYDYDIPAAEREFKRSIELDPNDSFAHQMYGWYLVSLRRTDEAIAEGQQAQSAEPFSSDSNFLLGQSLYYAHRYDEAIAQLRNTLDLGPDVWATHDLLGWCYEAKGDLTGAIAEFEKARSIEPAIAEPLASLGRAYALQKRHPEVRKVLGQLKELSNRNYVPPYNVAWIYAALGEKDHALAMLEKAYDERSWYIVLLAVDPKVDNLRSDPRFANLVRRVGLPQ